MANLAKVGITEELAMKKVTQLSGGQQQRVAIVRAICCEHGWLIVADEPTGNLDETTSKDIVQLFQEIAHEQKKCIILVTHEQEVAKSLVMLFYELKERQFVMRDSNKLVTERLNSRLYFLIRADTALSSHLAAETSTIKGRGRDDAITDR